MTTYSESSIRSYKHFTPGLLWVDTSGSPINAHGGGVIHYKGRYYWYGEHKIPGRSEEERCDGGVHCYSSADLMNWSDEGVVLSVDYNDPTHAMAFGGIYERPKVLYNEPTKRFVMFFKLYPPGTGMDTGYVGVATADGPAGPFTYQHRFNGGGLGKGTGDFAMVLDKSGTAYHLAVRKPDKVFVAARLRPDFLMPESEHVPVEGIERHTEAPAVIRADGGYYLIGSGSTGFDPNAARAFFAHHLTGPYRPLGNPVHGVNPHNNLGPEKTFGGQISFVIPVVARDNSFIAMFDLWKPERAIEGGYIWLPVDLNDGSPQIRWRSEWGLDDFTQPRSDA